MSKKEITISSINGMTFLDFIKKMNPVMDVIAEELDGELSCAKDNFFDSEGDAEDDDVENFYQDTLKTDEELLNEYGEDQIDITFQMYELAPLVEVFNKIKALARVS